MMEGGITVFHKDETFQQKQKDAAVRKPKRGPLDIREQIALIKVCEKRAKYKEISEVSSTKFWIGIEVALQREIGRRYSHYSCRRRITEYIAQRAIYRDAIKNGQPPPFQLMDPDIRSMLDAWKEMDELKEQLEKEKALGQLVGHDPEVPQSNKLQRVAAWVKTLPDPDPQSIVTPPTTDSSPSPAVREEPLWAARHRKWSEDDLARFTQRQVQNHDMACSRLLLSNIKDKLTLAYQDPRATQALAGVKRPREDEPSPDRATQRPRTQFADPDTSRPVLKQNPGSSQSLLRLDNAPTQTPIETVFGKFWDSMLPYFKERALKEGLSITKSESIMHELFKEVGAAMTRAFMKLEQSTRPSAP
ncbi:uncharacterized protein BJX67DRAFT_349047 [Aspergillus lucknowensis]|uniref:Uncharacterized protein n=1 Tax=Aspergillus lucknowensis TaxID=176173 RepID=A0ABR4LW56_9EURO